MKKIFNYLLYTLILVSVASCETSELELLESPNNVTPDSADINFILNDVQLTFNGIYGGLSGATRSSVRMTSMFGPYNGNVGDGTVNGTTGEWASAYQMFSNIEVMQTINDGDEEGFPLHLGMAQVLKAYTYLLLVDSIGDIPFSEANQPELFPNPSVDGGRSIYDAQLALLDEAIANLRVESTRTPQFDLYYGTFEADKWVALANTVKLRAYANLRLIDPAGAAAGINSLIGGNIIDTIDEDFQFLYGTNVASPDTRHPLFSNNYLAAGATSFYMANYMYDIMNVGDDQTPFVENGTADPRARYYFYRQDDDAPTGSNLPCLGDDLYVYCYVGNLYWGRDHADGEGIPADAARRSTYGIYPAGGAFDRNELTNTVRAENLAGAGVRPIYLASWTHFLLAETALTINAGGNPAGLLEQGIRLSMEKVLDFAGGVNTNDFNDETIDLAATQADVDAYVSRVISEYNSGNASQKLAVIAREAFIANWSNGVEPYNTYRRTGEPNLQSPIQAAGAFPRSISYPADEVVSNPNITQKPLSAPVFWDNGSAGAID